MPIQYSAVSENTQRPFRDRTQNHLLCTLSRMLERQVNDNEGYMWFYIHRFLFIGCFSFSIIPDPSFISYIIVHQDKHPDSSH